MPNNSRYKMHKKYGFTLAEVLIVLMVIGIIMAMSIPVISAVNTSYTQSTYAVYKNLQAAVTQMMSGSPHPYKNGAGIDDVTIGFGISDIKVGDGYLSEHEVFEDETSRTRNLLYSCRTGNGKNLTLIRQGNIPWEIEFPGPASDGILPVPKCSDLQDFAGQLYAQNLMFNDALAGLLNVGSGKFADGYYIFNQNTSTHLLLRNVIWVKGMGEHAGEPIVDPVAMRTSYYKNAHEGSCIGASCIPPNIVTSNGQFYFVSRWAKMKEEDDFGFRLVAVDLNGFRGPNITLGEDGNYEYVGMKSVTGAHGWLSPKGKIPDIVTFIVWDNGEVYPLGVAADDYKFNDGKKERRAFYLPSEAKGYDFSSGKNIDVPTECTYAKNDPKRDKLAPGGCNYNRINIGKDLKEPMTFRQAYCTAFGQKERNRTDISFEYCPPPEEEDFLPDGITYNECPRVPGIKTDAYDFCKVEPIKPVFKFNMD